MEERESLWFRLRRAGKCPDQRSLPATGRLGPGIWSFSGAWNLKLLHLRHRILQCTDPGDADANDVVPPQREIVRRIDARAGQQHRAVRENLAPEKKAC